jgi:hypothetical protein
MSFQQERTPADFRLGLLDVNARNRASDDESLDLAVTFKDGVGIKVTRTPPSHDLFLK